MRFQWVQNPVLILCVNVFQSLTEAINQVDTFQLVIFCVSLECLLVELQWKDSNK